MKRILCSKKIRIRTAVIMALLIGACALCPLSAFAQDGVTGGLSWKLENGTLIVSGKGEMPDYSKSGSPWHDSADSLEKVVLMSGVKTISKNAFYNCTKLSSVSFSSTVEKIGDGAFEGCTALKKVSFPYSVKKICDKAFKGCESLEVITLSAGIESIGASAFEGCSELVRISVPETVVDLGKAIFADCKKLTDSVLLCPVSKIPEKMFYNCEALETVSITEETVSLGKNAFKGCNSLKEVLYPGDTAKAIEIAKALSDDPSTASASIIGEKESAAHESSGSDKKEKTEMISLPQNGETEITEHTETVNQFAVNGIDASFKDVKNVGGEDTLEITGSKEKTVLSVTIDNLNAWKELSEAAVLKEADLNELSAGMELRAELKDSTVKKEDLILTAGRQLMLEITTKQGVKWRIDQALNSRSSFSKDVYDLNASKKKGKNDSAVKCDDVFVITVEDDIDFAASVGIELGKGSAMKYASVSKGRVDLGGEHYAVLIDKEGFVWLPSDALRSGEEYYVAVAPEEFDASAAIIPDTLSAEDGLNDKVIMTDAQGNKYLVGEKKSAWGITGGRFALYVGIAVFGIVLIITLVMITLNKIKRNKDTYKYMLEEERNSDNISDDDRMRSEILKEILEKSEKE